MRILMVEWICVLDLVGSEVVQLIYEVIIGINPSTFLSRAAKILTVPTEGTCSRVAEPDPGHKSRKQGSKCVGGQSRYPPFGDKF